MKHRTLTLVLILALCNVAGYAAEGGLGPRRANALVTGYPEAGATLGAVLACGNFLGDAKMELAIGAPLATDDGQTAAGAVYIYTFDLRQPILYRFLHDALLDARGPEANDLFGSSFAVGDFDGNGYDDLAIGVPGQDVNGLDSAGAVRVFLGSESALTHENNFTEESGKIGGAVEENARFGDVLAAGDLNGDGYDDLVIGCPNADVGAQAGSGEVYVIYGSPSGLDGGVHTGGPIPITLRLDQAVPGVPGSSEAGDHFGGSLAVGYLNDDEYADLAVGLPGEDVETTSNAGAVIAFLGSAGGITTASADWFDFREFPAPIDPAADDRFGANLALPPEPHGKLGVLAISMPNFTSIGGNSNVGLVVHAIYEDGELKYNGYTAIPTDVPLQEDTMMDGPVLIRDVNHDGVPDLLIGFEKWDVAEQASGGAVLIVQGRWGASNLVFERGGAFRTQWDSGMTGDPAAYDLFGSALAAGDFNGDGRNDMAVGMPGYDADSKAWAGAASVLLTPASTTGATFILNAD